VTLIPASRPPLPVRAIPQEIVGHDTRAQAAENRRHAEEYLEKLARWQMPLPAAPQQLKTLGIAEVSREAGLSLGVLRSEHPIRQLIEAAIPRLGLAIIVHESGPVANWSIAECRIRFLSLAPAKAAQVGFKPEAMELAVTRVFDVITNRAFYNTEVPALPIARLLQQDDRDGALDLTDTCLSIIRTFEDWAAQCNTPSKSLSETELRAMAFHDLLLHGMNQTGLSQSEVGKIVGLPQSTVWKWLREGRAPNVRSHPALRALALHFGFPEDTLVHAIRSMRQGGSQRLSGRDFPVAFRGLNFKTVRTAVKSRLTEDDFQLSAEAFEARIADLCAVLEQDYQPHRKRKAMRDQNRIDRTLFPGRLTHEIEKYRAYLEQKGNAKTTQASYVGHIEGFFNFALSSEAPENLRLGKDSAMLCAVASKPLWDAYFRHLLEIGKQQMGATFLLNRSLVERMKAIVTLFGSADLFLSNASLSVGLRPLATNHLPWATKELSIEQLCAGIASDLKEFRHTWYKKSRKPKAGRDEIADLLSSEDPLLAVRQMIDYMRGQIEHIQKYEPRGENEAMRVVRQHYATAYRKLIVIHLLGQTALRVGMVPKITVGENVGDHLSWKPGTKPLLVIPADLFKNGASDVFKEGPYKRTLEDIHGFYKDLQEYLETIRPRLLDGTKDNRLFLSWSARNGAKPVDPAVVRAELTEISRASVGADAPDDKRLTVARHLRPHHFRDILATAILHLTDRNYALAGDAIHVSEETARTYYAHDSVEMRRPDLEAVFRKMAKGQM
jgi:integrase/transcriptional regulator with XRE-family HTH domain